MAERNLHDKPLDEGTLAKLQIFESYAQAWIPTFVLGNFPTIAIFDLFAGTGYDLKGVPGSPIRLLQQVREHLENIELKGTKVRIYLNEYKESKYQLLRKACEEFLIANPRVAKVTEIEFHNEDFDLLFPQILPIIESLPSLVYLDQNGIKYLKYLPDLAATKQTDFLYFVSSSFFLRFGETPEFRANFEIDIEKARLQPYHLINRFLIQDLRKRTRDFRDISLYPFSIKKGANYYGIVFGASHPLAVKKFLEIAWKANSVNGEANFDIDDDVKKDQLLLFGEQPLKKIEAFQKVVRAKILSRELKTNEDLFKFTLSEGHIGSHSSEVLKQMKKAGEVDFEGSWPLVTYEKVFKEGRIIKYLVKHETK